MTEHHEHLNPLCSSRTIANFLPRRAILNVLTEQLSKFQGTFFDIGCGSMPYKPIILSPPSRVEKYIGLDLRADLIINSYSRFAPPDLEWDGRMIQLDSDSVDCAIATEVLIYCHDVESFL